MKDFDEDGVYRCVTPDEDNDDPCPFQEEMAMEYLICHCCRECREECAMDI